MEELDERAFLFRIQSGVDGHHLGGFAFDKWDGFGLLGRFESGGRLGDLLLCSRHLCWIQILLGVAAPTRPGQIR